MSAKQWHICAHSFQKMKTSAHKVAVKEAFENNLPQNLSSSAFYEHKFTKRKDTSIVI